MYRFYPWGSVDPFNSAVESSVVSSKNMTWPSNDVTAASAVVGQGMISPMFVVDGGLLNLDGIALRNGNTVMVNGNGTIRGGECLQSWV